MASSSRFLQALKTSPHCLRVLTTFLEIVLAWIWGFQNVKIIVIVLLFLISQFVLRSSMVPLVPSQQLNTRTHVRMIVRLWPLLTCSQWLSPSRRLLMHQHTLHSQPNTTEQNRKYHTIMYTFFCLLTAIVASYPSTMRLQASTTVVSQLLRFFDNCFALKHCLFFPFF